MKRLLKKIEDGKSYDHYAVYEVPIRYHPRKRLKFDTFLLLPKSSCHPLPCVGLFIILIWHMPVGGLLLFNSFSVCLWPFYQWKNSWIVETSYNFYLLFSAYFFYSGNNMCFNAVKLSDWIQSGLNQMIITSLWLSWAF